MKVGDSYITYYGNGLLVITITEILKHYVRTNMGTYSKRQITLYFSKY